MTTNKQFQEWLKQFPDDAEIQVPCGLDPLYEHSIYFKDGCRDSRDIGIKYNKDVYLIVFGWPDFEEDKQWAENE